MNAKASAIKVCPGCSARYPPDALFCPNDGSPLSADYVPDAYDGGGPTSGGRDPYLGREISGHIEIRRLAGVGAMGKVYRAFQRGIDRDVAVKVLHRELSANQQLVARFHREAKVASRLSHPNVVSVHLAGQLPDGAMYIVMEYLDGLSLQSAVAAAGAPFPLERALHIALQICDATGEAHAQGVVHRDIKPENVMLVRRGEDLDFVKVLDFGIARLNWGEQSMATAAGLIFGTARYISPEGAQGEAVGPGGDVYATATLLYQMLAGRTPFEGEQAVALLVQQIHDAPPDLRSIPAAASVPEPIAEVIMKNLAKSPEGRAPDGRMFGRALVEAARASGLGPDEFAPRSSLFAPHARLSDPGPASAARVDVPKEPRSPDMSGIHAAALSPATPQPGVAQKTQLWSPPSPSASPSPVPLPPLGRHAERSEASPEVPPARASSPAPANDHEPPPIPAEAVLPANVDRTLDDATPVHAESLSSVRVRTEPALLPPVGLMLPAMVSPPQAGVPPVSPPQAGVPAAPAALPPEALAAPPESRGVGVTLLKSAIERVDPASERGGLGGDDDEGRQVPAKRLVGVVLICLLVGVLGAGAILYQLGLVGGTVRPGSIEEVLGKADDALKHGRWDVPAGDNVKDLTNDGLSRFPRDARLLDVRSRATDELVKEAVGRKFAGDLPAALHLAHLARELDPDDTTAQHLVDEYEQAEKKAPPEPSSHGAVTTVAPPTPHGGATHPTSSGAASSSAPRVTVEPSLAHPRVGQSVTFTAKVLGPTAPAKSIEDPRFVINGPGLTTDTRLGTLPAGAGVYTATFTGFEPGKHEVAFDAKVDGALVRVTRSVVFEGDAPPPLPSAPPPPTVPSGKWL